jgi:hypothetical protein
LTIFSVYPFDKEEEGGKDEAFLGFGSKELFLLPVETRSLDAASLSPFYIQ